MEITERLKEIIFQETNVDIVAYTRKRNAVELRSLYYTLIKHFKPKTTLYKMAESVERNHATIIHSLNNYSIYEKFNDELKYLKNIIINQIEEENISNTEDKEQLKLQIKKKGLKIFELQMELEELNFKIKKMEKAKYEYKIIENLNELMIQTTGTDKQELINIRLQAFYDMNKQR